MNAGTNLAFDVSVQNSGDVQVVGVQVTITIKQAPSPITATQKIAQINPGDTKVVVFKNLRRRSTSSPRRRSRST